MRSYDIFLIVAISWIAGLVLVPFSLANLNNTITFCRDANTSVIIESYEVCGTSPVLNPSNSFCQNYTQTREELCASGCDTNVGTCIPPPIDRTFTLAVIFIGIVAFILVLARWY